MQHLGDICWINGAETEPVDVIIGGSPCQDLSVAGKQAGLAGERSGLFMEQIRIIKEMREADAKRTTEFVRPRFMVWENVPGALSSNKSEDFRTVLEETARIAQPDAVVPRPPKGKWRTSGCILGSGWSIAWRVLDAQFWGVPQRRRRIALIADFGGHAAPEILFERKGLLGDTAEGGRPRQTAAAGTESSIRAAGAYKTFDCRGRGNGLTSNTLTGDHQNRVTDYTAIVMPTKQAYSFDSMASNSMKSSNPYSGCRVVDIAKTLDASCPDPSKNQGGIAIIMATGQANAEVLQGAVPTLNCNNEQPIVAEKTVRRFTPLECERLQGFPDGWTDIGAWRDSKGKLHKESSDSARYRALGNSIALPPWRWVLLRLSGQFYRPATLGSLFDGIGGFPLIWESINGRRSCLWTSEVDEFCIAVTKRRFGGI